MFALVQCGIFAVYRLAAASHPNSGVWQYWRIDVTCSNSAAITIIISSQSFTFINWPSPFKDIIVVCHWTINNTPQLQTMNHPTMPHTRVTKSCRARCSTLAPPLVWMSSFNIWSCVTLSLAWKWQARLPISLSLPTSGKPTLSAYSSLWVPPGRFYSLMPDFHYAKVKNPLGTRLGWFSVQIWMGVARPTRPHLDSLVSRKWR